MISHLSQQHEVTVASIARTEAEAEEAAGLSQYCFKVIPTVVGKFMPLLRMILRLPSLTPSSMGYFYSPSLEKQVNKVLTETKFDLIFVHCSSVAQYVENIEGIPKILDFGDMDSQKWLEYSTLRSFPLTIGYYIEGRKLLRAEKKLAQKFDYCSCTTKAEMETLRGYQVDVPTGWFPNGVDHEVFKPSSDPYDPDTICFIGRMDYYPNQECMFDFCKNTLPLIQKIRPAAKLIIIGANPSKKIVQLSQLPGVTVTGSVPSVQPYVLRSAVNIAPLNIARGTQNKILESLAMGVPVVSSPQAASGIDAVPGEHFLVARTPQEYSDAILSILEDSEVRGQLARAGRERMLSHHDWKTSMLRLDELVDTCVKRQ